MSEVSKLNKRFYPIFKEIRVLKFKVQGSKFKVPEFNVQSSRFKVLRFKFAQVVTLNFLTLNVELS